MKYLTIKNLECIFKTAKEMGYNFVAVLIKMEGFEKPEIIINQIKNFDSKLAYYKNTYDENLNHKFAKGIKIIGLTYDDTFEGIENEFEEYFTIEETII